MLTTIDIIIFGVGLVILIIWLIFFFAGLKYASLFDPLDEKDYPMKEIYFTGYAFMEMIHYEYRSAADRKLRKEITILYGEKYADYYIRVIYAKKVSFAMLLLAMAVPFYGFTGSYLLIAVIIAFAGVAYYYYGTTTTKQILSRSEEMLRDFSNVISKLALLTNAGMIMREAWEEVAYTEDTPLYQEMQRTVEEMNNGVSEIDAFYTFGSRCILPEIKKFTSTIVQGITKGNSELTKMLQEQSSEVWDAKKQNARRQGEKAASELLMPTMLMFVGILIMILIPIFTNLGV